MDEQSLELVLIELSANSTDIVSQGFSGAITTVAEAVGGRILFNIRVDEFPDCQRIAAIEKSGDVSMLLLSQDGRSMQTLAIGKPQRELSSSINSLSDWYTLPIRERQDQSAARSDALDRTSAKSGLS